MLGNVRLGLQLVTSDERLRSMGLAGWEVLIEYTLCLCPHVYRTALFTLLITVLWGPEIDVWTQHWTYGRYHNFGHYSSPFFYLKHVFSKIGFCLCFQVKPTYMGPIEIANLCVWTRTSQSQIKVILRPKISRLVRLAVRRPSGTRDQFFFLLEIFF
jgi:hypothetical protein